VSFGPLPRVLLIERFAEHGGAQSVLLDRLARLDRSSFEPGAR
jgi:hypothetical protein